MGKQRSWENGSDFSGRFLGDGGSWQMTGMHVFIVLTMSSMEERDKAKNIRGSALELLKQDVVVKLRYMVHARRVLETANTGDGITGNRGDFKSLEWVSDCFLCVYSLGPLVEQPGAAVVLWHSSCIAVTAEIDHSCCPACSIDRQLKCFSF